MFAKDALEEFEQWRRTTISPQHQLDWRWVERYRQLDSYDAYWWWAQAGPFTNEEQRQWDHWYTPQIDEATKEQLGKLIAQSRQRELEAALAERRQPRFHYPALDIDEVRRRITGMLQLDAEISQQEPNALVRRLYHGAIEDESCFLSLIEATHEGDNQRFWTLTQRLFPAPTSQEVDYALSRLRHVILQGLLHPETTEASQRVIQALHEQLHISLDFFCSEAETLALQKDDPFYLHNESRKVSCQAVKRFFEAALREGGYQEWQIIIDPKESGARVESASRQLFLPDRRFSLDEVRDYLAHELAGHVVRSVAGESSLVGLLGMNTKNYSPTEEGVALYHERQVTELHGDLFNDSGTWFGALAIGLASGVVAAPQTFFSLFAFFEPVILLYRLLWHLDEDPSTAQKRARQRALTRCLRTYRGVPDLEQAGICLTKDVVYLRGLHLMKRAVAENERILDLLSVGKIAYELLPTIQELGIHPPPQSLRKLAYDPELYSYIRSFESPEHASLVDGEA